MTIQKRQSTAARQNVAEFSSAVTHACVSECGAAAPLSTARGTQNRDDLGLQKIPARAILMIPRERI
jgi:hypothetical protein